MKNTTSINPSDFNNIFDFLKAKCEEAGTNITQLCVEAGVQRQNIEKWKHNNPKTLETLALLIEAIARIELKKSKEKKVISSAAGIKLTRRR